MSGLHCCVGCGVELDGDDSSDRCEDCPNPFRGLLAAGEGPTMIRPLRRRLSDDSIALMDEQRAAGLTPQPVHLMLVDESGRRERGRTACGGGLGEWVTGAAEQVTCHPCLEQAHA